MRRKWLRMDYLLVDGLKVGWKPHTRGRTNNYTEYSALLDAIIQVPRKHPSKVLLDIRGDSMLITQQLLRAWAVNDATLKPPHEQIRALLSNYDYTMRHTKRKWNKAAD